MASLQNSNGIDSPTPRDDSLARLAAAAESRADALSTTNNYSAALDVAIQAAELYMRARREAVSSIEKQRLDQKCSAVLAKAERWKKENNGSAVGLAPMPGAAAMAPPPTGQPRKRPGPRATKKLTVKEQTLLLRSSKINGGIFPPWKGPPAPSEFSEGPFLDPDGYLQLSESQKSILDGWKRPREIHENARIIPEDGESVDLTQDIITDCSVVASLCVSSRREEKGFGETVANIIYPQNEKGQPTISPSGKYVVKLFFNGCYRKVIVDDCLPVSRTGRALYVTCRNHPETFVHALIEKAYLKIMGGYDFPGSNSGTDLLSLTGWIPEHVFLQSDEIVFSVLWKRMWKAWVTGEVLITLGTGRMTAWEEIELGLVGEHDYAVLELKEKDGDRLMLVKNPWSEGTVWRGAPTDDDDDSNGDFDAPNETSNDELNVKTLKKALPSGEPLQPGVFWISLENVCRNYASIYLNWNPTLFTHVHDTHVSWDLSTKISETSFSHNPQFSISNTSSTPGIVWVLLSRHLGLPNTASEGMIKSGFISLYLFDTSGRRVYLSSSSLHRTPYVDSPQTLLNIDNFPAGMTYTLVISSQELSKTTHHFSLAIYSLSPLNVTPAQEAYQYALTLSSSWTSATSGGNAQSPLYPRNPQFVLTVASAVEAIALLLETSAQHSVHVKLVHSSGERIASVTTRDIVAESGEYALSTALASTRHLPAGRYTVVASTFEPGQLADFKLTLLSTAPDATFSELPSETAGCFETVAAGVWETGKRRVVLPVDVGRLMGVWVKVRSVGPIRVQILREEMVVVESGAGQFEDLPMGVRTKKVDLGWVEGGYRVAIERIGGSGGERWEIGVISEGTLWVGEEEDCDEVGGEEEEEGEEEG